MSDKKQNLAMPIAIVIAGIIIAGAVLYSNKKEVTPNTQKTDDTTITDQKQPSFIDNEDTILSSGHSKGDEKAPLTLIEFSDPECPYCARFHATMDTIFEKYGKSGQLAWRYVHLFPFDSRPDVHPNSRKKAEAAECAASVGGEDIFWKFLSNVFESEQQTDMSVIAKDLGLDTKAFDKCVEDKTFADSVDKQHNLSYNTLGFRGTPHSVVLLQDGTGYEINGAYPIDTVAITLEAALAGVKADKIQKFLNMFQEKGTTEDSINAYVQEVFIPVITSAKTSE